MFLPLKLMCFLQKMSSEILLLDVLKLYNVVSQIRLCVTRLKKCVWDEVMEFYYYSAHLKGCVSTL